MTKKVINADKEFSIIDIQKNDILSIVQIKHSKQNSFNYISLHNAFNRKLIEISEISESGQVGQIKIINQSNSYVFIMDGDILKGAKQNRVLNSSVLLAPRSENLIPVSCVEQGRWGYNSNKFSPSDEIAYRKIREEKNQDIYYNKSSFKHFADQGKVWSNVNQCFDDLRVDRCVAPTGSHSDLFSNKNQTFKNYTSSFYPIQGANGLAYFLGKRLVGFEFFNRSDIYLEYFDKILKSIAIDVDRYKIIRPTYKETLSDHLISEIIYNSTSDFENTISRVDICKGIALGEENRLVEYGKTYYRLSYENHLIHDSLLSSNDFVYGHYSDNHFKQVDIERRNKEAIEMETIRLQRSIKEIEEAKRKNERILEENKKREEERQKVRERIIKGFKKKNTFFSRLINKIFKK